MVGMKARLLKAVITAPLARDHGAVYRKYARAMSKARAAADEKTMPVRSCGNAQTVRGELA